MFFVIANKIWLSVNWYLMKQHYIETIALTIYFNLYIIMTQLILPKLNRKFKNCHKYSRFLESLNVGKATVQNQISVDICVLISRFRNPNININAHIKTQTLYLIVPYQTQLSFHLKLQSKSVSLSTTSPLKPLEVTSNPYYMSLHQ